MEFLKPVLGDELYAQVETALKGNDKIKLANLADGQYIGKDKYDALEATKNTLEADNKKLKEVDSAALQTENEQLKKGNASLKLNSKVDVALMGAKAVNVTAVKSLLDMSKVSLDDKGNLVGVDEQINTLKESQKWAFEQATVPGAGGNPPAAEGGEKKSSFADAIQERMES